MVSFSQGFGLCRLWCGCFVYVFTSKVSFDLFHFVFVVFLYVGVISVNLFMCVDSIASQVLSQACVSETCLSVLFHVVVIVGGFNICIRCCWCFSCGRLLVVVGVGGAFMFVRDGHFLRQIQICIAG